MCITVAQIPADRAGLLNGEEMGQAAAADLNGYPAPKRVLDLATDMKLSPDQKKSIQAISNETKSRAIELGKRIIAVEEELNDAFQSGLVSSKTVQESADQIGKMRSRLRALHLTAHLRVREILTPEQLDLYKKLQITPQKKRP